MIKNRNLIVDAMVSSLTTYFSGLGTELITSVHNTLSVDFTNKASVITVTASGSNYHLDRFDGLYSIFPIAVNLFVVIPSVHHNLAPADLKPEVLLNDIEFQFFTWLLANQSTDHWNQLLPVREVDSNIQETNFGSSNIRHLFETVTVFAHPKG